MACWRRPARRSPSWPSSTPRCGASWRCRWANAWRRSTSRRHRRKSSAISFARRWSAGARSSRSSASRRSSAPTPRSLELVGNLGETRLGAELVLVLPRRSAHPDGADRLVTDLDRDAAAQRNDVSEAALAGEIRGAGRPLRPFHRGAAEGERGHGLAPRQLDVGEAGAVALQVGAEAAGAVEHRDRNAVAVLLALRRGGFDDGPRHAR